MESVGTSSDPIQDIATACGMSREEVSKIISVGTDTSPSTSTSTNTNTNTIPVPTAYNLIRSFKEFQMMEFVDYVISMVMGT